MKSTRSFSIHSSSLQSLCFPLFGFLLFDSQLQAGAHIHLNQQLNKDKLAAWMAQPAICAAWGACECTAGDRDALQSVSLFPALFLSEAGSRWQAVVARHGSLGCQEMAIIAGSTWPSEPLSALYKVPLYVLGDSSPKFVHGCREEGIKNARYIDQYGLWKLSAPWNLKKPSTMIPNTLRSGLRSSYNEIRSKVILKTTTHLAWGILNISFYIVSHQ